MRDPIPAPAEALHPAVRQFGSTLVRLRKGRGWSQRGLADLAGVSYSTVSRMESEPGRDFSFENAAKVAAAFGLTLVEFLTVPPCDVCGGAPPTGFTCNSCGATSGDVDV